MLTTLPTPGPLVFHSSRRSSNSDQKCGLDSAFNFDLTNAHIDQPASTHGISMSIDAIDKTLLEPDDGYCTRIAWKSGITLVAASGSASVR